MFLRFCAKTIPDHYNKNNSVTRTMYLQVFAIRGLYRLGAFLQKPTPSSRDPNLQVACTYASIKIFIFQGVVPADSNKTISTSHLLSHALQ